MGRAAKFKKGQLIRRKAKSKSISSSTNNNHHQPNPTKSTVTKNPNQEQIINWLLDPELHDWIYRGYKKFKTPLPMKVKGHGQAKVLNTAELQRLFTEGFPNPRDRALFGICLFTGCRISEALALEVSDIKGGTLTFRKSTTKGKLKTRQVAITDSLKPFLDNYQPKRRIGDAGFLFPGKQPWKHLSRYAADKLLRAGCSRIGVEGVSTHSFRRTALTQMHNAGIPLKHIQEISGHHDLGTLQAYLEVSTEQKHKAVSVIGW